MKPFSSLWLRIALAGSLLQVAGLAIAQEAAPPQEDSSDEGVPAEEPNEGAAGDQAAAPAGESAEASRADLGDGDSQGDDAAVDGRTGEGESLDGEGLEGQAASGLPSRQELGEEGETGDATGEAIELVVDEQPVDDTPHGFEMLHVEVPAVAPEMDAPIVPTSPPPGGQKDEHEGNQYRVIRTLLGLLALLALAYIGAHPRVQELERRLGISQALTSGLPFVFLGLLARAPGIEVLNDEVLIALTPLLFFGLGWIGFNTGFQFEAAALNEVPQGTSSTVLLLTGSSFAITAVVCGALLYIFGLDPDLQNLVRDAVIIGLAGALSSPILSQLTASRMRPRAVELAHTIAVLDDVVGVIGLAMLFSWVHPARGTWELPGVGWLFVTFGMAATLGLVMYAVLRGTDSSAESTAVLLGCVCFTAGMAGFFSIPPLVVCFFAGVLLKNLPGSDKPRLATAFSRMEKPTYLVFFVVVGAMWNFDSWMGWALLPAFVISRIVGRWIGARMARQLPDVSRHPGIDEIQDPELVAPPMGALALAFVVTAQTLYSSSAIRAVVTAVIGGSIASEIIVQIAGRRTSALNKAPKKKADAAPSRASELSSTEVAITTGAHRALTEDTDRGVISDAEWEDDRPT